MTEETVIVAVYNIDDDTLRLTCPEAERFPSLLLAQAKDAGFRHWRGSKQLVGTWTPERDDFARLHAATVEQVEVQDDPQARIERFERYGQGAESRAQERRTAASKGLPPMGEPIKVDHHSARRHRKAIERSDANMARSFEEQGKAEHWARKAEGTRQRARLMANPGTVRNRIKALEADLRSQERKLALTTDELGRLRAERWIEHVTARLAFERARLARLEPEPPAAPTCAVGEVVWWSKFGRCEVVSAGPKNCRVKVLDGGARGIVLRVARDELKVPVAE